MEHTISYFIVSLDNGNYLGWSGGLYTQTNDEYSAALLKSEDEAFEALDSIGYVDSWGTIEVCVKMELGECYAGYGYGYGY